MLKYATCFAAAVTAAFVLHAQQIDKIINEKAVEAIERTLSSDEMQGRRTFTPGIDKAAAYLAEEFRKAGIQPVKGSYLQEFRVPQTQVAVTGTIDGSPLNRQNVAVLSARENFTLTNDSAFEKVIISKTDTFRNVIRKLQGAPNNFLVMVDTAHNAIFNSLRRSGGGGGGANQPNFVFISGTTHPAKFTITMNKKTEELPLKNVVGMIPGKSKKDEIVIFSAHYDHLGITTPNADRDSIYNGANDDAAGTTAVVLLARYFAAQKNNERTIVFAAFTGEEMGMFGSRHFSAQYDSSKVVAMFNIEMIGTESKWGKNSAYITGYEKTDLGKILEKNLTGTQFKFYPDPYTAQQLFYRSDNATLARQGVAAHTISTSKMDSEKYYHTVDDEIETLDMKNMTEIIKAIAVSAKSIIAGKDTPTRVDAGSLRSR
jgi:hypothetical protein